MREVRRWVVVAGLTGALLAPEGRAQGSLVPPGPPGPAMRTLEQIEPRTPISSVPYTITQPGSYFVTTNLISDTSGITIRTNHVVVDLMGFSLSGDGGDDGVRLDPVCQDVVVRNGVIRGFMDGVFSRSLMNCRFESLSLMDCSARGIYLTGQNAPCMGNTIANCVISGNVILGIEFEGNLKGCTENLVVNCIITCNAEGIRSSAGGGPYAGNRIAGCTISSNTLNGVVLDSSVHRCEGNSIVECFIRQNQYDGVRLVGSSGQCDGNRIVDCSISGNGHAGIQALQANGTVITGCSVISNSQWGVRLDGAAGRCTGNTLTECTVAKNGGHGIYLLGETGDCSRNVIERCRVVDSVARGIYLSGSGGACEGNVIRDCVMGGNAGIGLSLYCANGNRLQGNHCQGQTGETTYGLQTASCTGNVAVCNTCIGHTYNFDFSASDTYGPIVTNSGALPSTGDASSPWANFSR